MTTFGYDGNHNRTSVTDAALHTTTTIFDERNLPYQTTDAESRVVRLHYHPNGALALVVDGNGHTTGYTPDDFGRLETITHEGGTTEQFLYDPAGNLTQKTTRAGQQITFSYDDRNRLRSRSSPTETATFLYDANGNLTSDGTNTYVFDAENRLVSATTASGAVSYGYDPFMRRTKKTVAGVATYFVWSGDDLLQEHDASLVRQRRYVVGPSYAPLQVGYSPGLTEPRGDVHADRLATPRSMSSSSGAWTWRGQFEAFGRHQIDPASTVEQNVRLPGQYIDLESGLYYNRFRHYAPSAGRYVSADPIGQAGGLNLYRYARNASTMLFDVLGLDVVNNSPNFIVVLTGGANEMFGGGDNEPSRTKCVPSGGVHEGSNDLVVNPATGEIVKTTDGIDATVGSDGSISTSVNLGLGVGESTVARTAMLLRGGSLSEAEARKESPKFSDAIDEANSLAENQSPVGRECRCTDQ